MAEMDFQERTEQATPKRQEEARRRGQVARSRELNIAAVLLAGAGVIAVSRGHFGAALEELMRRGLSPDPRMLDQPGTMTSALATASLDMLLAFAPLLVALALAAVGGALAVGGWVFSTEQFVPRWSRLDPVQGIKRILSLRGLVEVAKALAKALVIGGFALGCLAWARGPVLALGIEPLGAAMDDAGHLVAVTLIACSFGMLVVAMADAPFQLWSHHRELRMTRQEIREELKETEGRPEVRSRIRALQQQLASRRMMKAVPTADVVVTNPTHFAVALRYDDRRMRAPVVVARGVDHVAARIRELAGQHRVALFEAPLLARALYWTTNLNQEIPGPLYVAVAQVLTYVYRLKAAVQAGSALPERPEVQVDASLATPRRGRRDTHA
ncbi:MAG: flagellar biosynthesis protein FlhB [Gammaproteobacteria bacterium]|nr:flagellar biosynthesis protein FlhB [Gammaproteobacteria bacterium]